VTAGIDLNALALLVEIIDAGSLRSAATRNKLSPSAVSYRLKTLETTLGVQLLRRTTRRIEPTAFGWRLYEHSRSIVEELAQVRAEASTVGQAPRGSVRLSVPTGLGDALITRQLIDFRLQYPDVELEVLFENRIFDLLADEIDIALRIISKPPESLRAMDLGAVDWVLCASPVFLGVHGVPTQLNDIASLEISCSAAVGRKLRIAAMRDGQRTTIEVEPRLRSENFLFLKQAVVAGVGVGILPFYQVEAELGSGQLVGLMPEYRFSVFGSRVMLLAVPDRFRTAASRVLIQFLCQSVRAELRAMARRFAAARLAPPSGSHPPLDELRRG